MNNKKEITLGTAALGLKYGVTNFSKKQSKKKLINILEYAWKKGVRSFDTAPGYNTERLIGDFLYNNNLTKKAKVFTKIPTIRLHKNFKDKIMLMLDQSLENIKVPNLDVLFFHDPKDIEFITKNRNFFISLKKFYPIKNYGFSIYNLKELKLAKKAKLTNIYQVPFNLLNNDFLSISKKLELHARSIFLQGLLISNKINKNLKSKNLIKSHLNYFLYFKKLNINPLLFNFSYLRKKNNFKSYIIGIDNLDQINQFFKYFNKSYKFKEKKIDIKILKSFFSKKNLDPRNWS